MYSDAHVHLSPHMNEILARGEVLAVASCATPAECAQAAALAECAPIFWSAGIHPWQANRSDWAQMQSWLAQASLVGEIGMDSVWCDIDLAVQRYWLEKQLAIACEWQKPVVLHTKGQEAAVLELIRAYPNTYHVHWYAETQLLDEYLALGCYMSVGPFPTLDAPVAAVAKETPLNRLLIETDGLEAVAWATGEAVTTADYLPTLARIADEVAALRKMTADEILCQSKNNLQRLLGVDKKQ